MCINQSSADDACRTFANAALRVQGASMNLARYRRLRGLNQRQLAELIGVDQSTIQRAEIMHPSAKLQTYRACADALGVSLAQLFADDRSDFEAALVEWFRRQPPERHGEIAALLALAKDPPPQADA